MKKYTKRLTALVITTLIVGVFPVVAIAQELPAGVDPQLPAGLPDSSSSASTAPAEVPVVNEDPNQKFILGLLAGAAVGVVVGGGTVWFTKKG